MLIFWSARHENSVRLIQPNLIQGSFDSSVSEHDSTSYTYDSSSYSFSSTTAPTNSSINTTSKTIDSSISDVLSVANNNSKSSLNNNCRNSSNNSNNNNINNNNNNDHVFILSPTPFNRKLYLNQQTNNHFIPSLSNTTNYNDNTTSCNVPTMNGHYNENNQNSFKGMNNNNNAPLITNETVATMTKNATQSNHFYSPEIETTLNLYSHSNDFYNNNNNNDNARIDIQRKGGGKGVQMNSQEKITDSMNLKNSYDTKNAFDFTMHNRPNNNINSSITILNDPSNTTNQGSDVSIDDAMPLSPRTTATTNKTLKRFVLTRSPLSSPSVTTPTSISPAPIYQNHHINERTPPSSAIENTNLSITKSHFNRISLLNNPYNLSHQNYDQIDPSFSSSTSELDKISSSITFSSNPSNHTMMTRFTKQPEPQQLRQENKQLSSLIKHQQPQQRITLNNNNYNNDNLSSVQSLSNHTDNIQSSNSTFSRISSPPSVFPRPAFWTPDVKLSRKVNNIIQEDPKTKVYKWFESYEAARLLVDFGLPITGFSPNLSSLTFSRVPEWFHGFLSREQAERLLTKTDKNGSFLLHLNESFLGYVISLFTSSYCNHFLVSVIAVKQTNSGSRNTTKSTYQLYGVANPEQFTDLRDLVKFYSVS
ncbi:uncharacterized protein DC041_0008057 [Schistosoma bovis]|uniref:SH2 domain-containing protein n=1 Tax=Schistosoma bovis TaxID=6184 RepID=A0A430QP19_SCHBO|nr:uncharacterized protein DC041_0008057 [Schistosoma bovis]